MFRWPIMRNGGICLAWLLLFSKGKDRLGDWDLDSDISRGRVASVGSRCLGCLARRLGDFDQAQTPKSVVGISKYGTLSSLVDKQCPAARDHSSF